MDLSVCVHVGSTLLCLCHWWKGGSWEAANTQGMSHIKKVHTDIQIPSWWSSLSSSYKQLILTFSRIFSVMMSKCDKTDKNVQMLVLRFSSPWKNIRHTKPSFTAAGSPCPSRHQAGCHGAGDERPARLWCSHSLDGEQTSTSKYRTGITQSQTPTGATLSRHRGTRCSPED